MKSKIKTREELSIECKALRNNGEKVVFTNGCFDIIHKGHVLYLHEAKNLGNKLIVGLNSDASVKRLKGNSRPVNAEEDRAIVLAALESVDYVYIFEEDTPYNLINAIKPDILVKGGDWKIDEIVGSNIVISNGGKVYSLSFHDGYSSTLIIEKIGKE